jgi:purine-nucleoside phosphorylase
MQSLSQHMEEAVAYLREGAAPAPRLGIVLGSGLGAFADRLTGAQRVPYSAIPHFPTPHVEGHAGELVLGALHGVPLAVMSGRVHYYEGHGMEHVTFPVRVLRGLGVQKLLVTNAAGGVNPTFQPGDFMVIHDHINLTGASPLRGSNDARLGPRFPDMSEAYSVAGRQAWHCAAREVGASLREGVYAGLAGPNYETPAEIRMLQRLGCDAVGMSTVAEVIVARHAGLEVAGLSVITNRAAGLSATPLSHAEVTEIAGKVRGVLCDVLGEMVRLWQ